MNKRAILVVFLVAGIILTNPFSFVFAQTNHISTLDGLKSVYVRVAATPGVLDAEKLQSTIENLLNDAEIKTLSESEFSRLKGSPRYPMAILDVSATAKRVEGINLIIYNIVVQVRQNVWLSRKPVIKTFAPTWELRETGNTPSVDVVNGRIKALTSRFVSDYHSINP